MDEILVVTPCHNEQEYILHCHQSLAMQTLKPTDWIIVDDRSTNGTPNQLKLLEQSHMGFTIKTVRKDVMEYPQGDPTFLSFRYGIDSVPEENRLCKWILKYDYVLKLDADTVIPPTYLEMMVERFKADPRLGIASGICENEPWIETHPRGNNRMYRDLCLDLVRLHMKDDPCIGWDTLDEVIAKNRGWHVKVFSDIVTFHMRPRLMNANYRRLQGETSRYLGYPWWYATARSINVTKTSGWKQGRAFLSGYRKNSLGFASPETRKMIRQYLRHTIKRRMGFKKP